MMDMSKIDGKKKVYLILGILLAVVLVAGVSFAYWYYVFVQKDENVLITDCFQMSFVEESGTDIYLEKGYPMTEKEALEYKPYQFKIKNICNSVNEYQINIESMESSTMPDRVMALKLNQNDKVLLREEVEPTVGEHAYVLEEGVIYPDETKEYEVWVWMDESTMMEDDASNKKFVGKITITTTYIKNYSEKILDGNDPVIKEPLIPVTIENKDGENVVRKADLTSDWYSYSDHRWANAVILKDEQQEKEINEVITEDEIESYFVWIPKFDYVIFDMGTDYTGLGTVTNKVNTIQVRFKKTSTTDTDTECKSPNKSGDIGTCEVGKWMTHPAFVDGFEGITGMWVGKFETSHNSSNNTNETNPNAVQIKPNVTSWRNIQVANMFYSSYDYKRNLDSHMMKNTEWGAVAYLTQSKYGKNSQVRINNNGDYLTGYSGVYEPTIGYTATNISCTTTPAACNESGTDMNVTRPWNDTQTLGLASTTGNVTGIYDMAGGAWEHVMGVIVDEQGNFVSGRHSTWNSNFIGTLTYPDDDSNVANRTKTTWTKEDGGVLYPENSKYYNLYDYVADLNDEHYENRILGDSTGELGPFERIRYDTQNRQVSSWNGDEGWVAYRPSPWFMRGGEQVMGTGTGVFTFGISGGHATDLLTFRVVLSL